MGFKNEQRRLDHRGRIYHFISYEAREANATKKQDAQPASWYLVSSGNRWPAVPLVPEQPQADLDAALAAWLDATVLAVQPVAPQAS